MNQEQFLKTVSFLKKKIEGEIPIGLILGTGLGGSAGGIKKSRSIPYEQIPYFPHSTVESHQGRLVWGTLAGSPVIALQGRFHLYEGYAPQEIGFPIRVLAGLGVRVLIVSNAAGGLDPLFEPGDLMLIMDHINFTGENPLAGPHQEYWGDRFPDLSAVYDRRLRPWPKRWPCKIKFPFAGGCTWRSRDPVWRRRRKRECSGKWGPRPWACPPSWKSSPRSSAVCESWGYRSFPTSTGRTARSPLL